MIPSDYEEPVSFWEWVRTQILLIIPGIGLVMLIYWAFSERPKTSKRNFARAQLFFIIPATILGISLLSFAAIPAFQKVRDSSRAKTEANARKLAEANTTETSSSATPNTSAFNSAPATSAPANQSAPTADASAPSASSAESAPRPTLTPDEPTRSLRSHDGRVIEARVVSLTDDDVTIVRVNGQEFTVPMSRFAPEEVEYFMRLRHGGGAFD